jgi:hypothetical protein
MQMPLNGLDSQQGSTQNRIDLSAIANEHPVNQKVAVLDLNTFDATQLTLLEVLDMSEVTGVEPELLGSLLSSKGNTRKRMTMFYALAWCIARRADPQLKFPEVCSWKIEVIGEVSEKDITERAEASKKRAARVVNVASVSGLPPSEARKLTVAEIGAYADRNARQNRAARRHAR